MMLLRRVLSDLSVLLMRGVIRHGCAVSMMPVPPSRTDEVDLVDDLRITAVARSGVREIEHFLRQYP